MRYLCFSYVEAEVFFLYVVDYRIYGISYPIEYWLPPLYLYVSYIL